MHKLTGVLQLGISRKVALFNNSSYPSWTVTANRFAETFHLPNGYNPQTRFLTEALEVQELLRCLTLR